MNQKVEKKTVVIGVAIAVTYFILVILNIVLIQPNGEDVFDISELYKGIEFFLCFGFGMSMWGAATVILSFATLIYAIVFLICRRIGARW